MVIKRKTVTKVTRSLKTNAKVKDVATQEAIQEQKLMKKPAAAAKRAAKNEEEEEEEEVEEETQTTKTMKRPAAASKKMDVDEEDEEEDEEDEDDDEDDDEEDDEEEDEEEETKSKVLKKPAGARAQQKVEEEEDEDEDEEEDEEDEDDEEEDEEDASAQLVAVEGEKEKTEKEVIAERTKELKAMPASDLKELMESNGLDKGTKEVMIKNLLKHEAKVRAVAKEQKAKIRGVVIQKKQELENMSTAELNKLCNDAGLKGLKSKPERVQRLLVQWQENDGVDQALTKIAQEERKNELSGLDSTKLLKLCKKLTVDPYVKEIMVERISKDEHLQGCYARPMIKESNADATQEKKGDMIDELLANEAERKKERIAREQKEAALSKRRKELKSMSVEELKKRIAKKGLETAGKREDMVEALFIASVQEDTAVARKAQLQSKSLQDLKELLTLNGLDTGSKDQMVKTMLAHEAKCRAELKAFEAKVDQAAAQKQQELEKQSKDKLKELCANKGLPTKGEKSERVERIIEEAKKEREFDRTVSAANRNKRKDELMAMDKPAVLKLCETRGVDPCVKDIMVERIMSAENEAGEAIAAADSEPPAKKARSSKK